MEIINKEFDQEPLIFSDAAACRFMSNRFFNKNNKDIIATVNNKIKLACECGLVKTVLEDEELSNIPKDIMERLLALLDEQGYKVTYINGAYHTDKKSKLTIKW